VRFRVLIDGQVPGAAHGIDVDEQGSGTVAEQRMYQLIRQPKPIADRQFAIAFLDSEVEAFLLRSRSADPPQKGIGQARLLGPQPRKTGATAMSVEKERH